ncbi:MAG TPA: translation elongation factor-like protein [candidate division WOR-3 bacterium]|uniref:Translation elongation factor-like protein n=1 Tax=candidate division WOR-3 bacterium TaxID=2052148 RepID=A0A9C9EMA1_UNCW3|nr:translation elongation factor-like protein [candidate division WOR-3 bacterium]
MEKLIGTITHYFGKIGVAVLKVTDDEVAVGDTIHIKGKHTDFTQTINSMQVEHENIEKAKKGNEVGLKVEQPVHEKDEVYKVTE